MIKLYVKYFVILCYCKSYNPSAVTLSAKSCLVLGENKAVIRREGHLILIYC